MAIDESGRPSFSRVQNFSANADAITFYAFDLLMWKGEDLRMQPLDKRRDLLRTSEYLRMLPKLYEKYSELPSSVVKQNRRGTGYILSKLGDTQQYTHIAEGTLVAQLAQGLSGVASYTLVTEAFFIDRQNLRLEALVRLFASLGFEQSKQFIETHPAISVFIARERPGSSAEKELQSFIKYRNEAAHKKVENLLSKDEIGVIGRFISALGYSLTDMVTSQIYQRRMTLNHYSVLLKIKEIHFRGKVVIGVLNSGVSLKAGEDIVIFGRGMCRLAKLEAIQLNGNAVAEATGDGIKEVGIRLSEKAAKDMELRRVEIPTEPTPEPQLPLVDVLPSMADAADTDLSEIVDGQVDVAASEDSVE